MAKISVELTQLDKQIPDDIWGVLAIDEHGDQWIALEVAQELLKYADDMTRTIDNCKSDELIMPERVILAWLQLKQCIKNLHHVIDHTGNKEIME
jgi:hypothetical protein